MVIQTPSVAPQAIGGLARGVSGATSVQSSAPSTPMTARGGVPASARASFDAASRGANNLSRTTTAIPNGSAVVEVGTDVQKSAETLFETRTVVEIRQVEANTRKNIEEKKHALRQLVGDSYRDLMASADTIMEMSATCSKVLDNIGKMQDAFGSLSNTMSANAEPAAEPEKVSKRKELYAVGSRIKYLVDTPEEIWGCLDTLKYLQAAWRFLRTVEVQRLLTDPAGPHAAKGQLQRFPLLRHQWPTIEKFRGQIIERVRQRLSKDAHLGSTDASVALAAAASLEVLDSVQAMELFLGQRRACLASRLSSSGAEGPSDVSAAFEEVANALQLCVFQVGELFLRSAIDGTQPLLARCVSEVEDDLAAGELTFEGTMDDCPTPEAAAWVAVVTDIRERLGALPPPQVEAAASKWLTEVAETVKAESGGLLKECHTPEELSRVEAHVRGAIRTWTKGGGDAAGTASDHFGQSNWEAVCDSVVGKQLDLWDLIFEAPFLSRGKELIDETFSDVASALDAPLEACLNEAASCTTEGPGLLASASWPYHLPGQTEAGTGSLKRGASHRASLHAPGGHDGLTWRQRIPALKDDFDAQLKAALEGCLALLSDVPAAGPSGPLRQGSGGSLSVRPGMYGTRSLRKRARVVELEPYIQERCAEAVATLATSIQDRVAALQAGGLEKANAQTVEQILLLARLASSLGESPSYLRMILGSPEDWYTMGSSGAQAALRSGREFLKRGSPQLAVLQQRLAGIGLRAHGTWAAWAAASLGQDLEAGLMRDNMLAATTDLSTWQETVLSQDDSMGADAEMKFRLPAFPTPTSAAFLLNSCRELQRAGGHLIGVSALQLLEWELGAAVISAVRGVLAASAPSGAGPPSKALTEKGVLQLLFDVRLLRDVLVGGRPAPPSSASPSSGDATSAGVVDPAVSAAISERKRAMMDLELKLQARLDPIDWATYEPYLWSNEACYYQRSSVMVGSLVHLQPLHSNAASKLPSNAATNVMNISPAVARFSYLPISQPQGDKNKLPRHSSLIHSSSLGGSLDECYSFADMGSRSLTASVTSAQPEEASSFAAVLQSKIQSRAAEITSMAASSFGTSSFGDLGVFSSLSGFASKR